MFFVSGNSMIASDLFISVCDLFPYSSEKGSGSTVTLENAGQPELWSLNNCSTFHKQMISSYFTANKPYNSFMAEL